MPGRSHSASVLDEADRFQTQLDWMLFTQEQDARIWAPPAHSGEWKPGDPLQTRPVAFLGEQWIRPMFQAIPIDQFNNRDAVLARIRCSDCDTFWRGNQPCWNCGVFDHPIGPRKYVEPLKLDISKMTIYADQINQGFIRAEETVRGFNSSFSYVDEMFEALRIEVRETFEGFQNRLSLMMLWGDGFGEPLHGIVPYYGPPGMEYSPFHVREPVRTHICGEAFDELYNPWWKPESYHQTLEIRLAIGNLDLSVRPRPIEPPDFEHRNWQLEWFLERQAPRTGPTTHPSRRQRVLPSNGVRSVR